MAYIRKSAPLRFLIVGITILALVFSISLMIRPVKAGSVTSFSDTISDSATSTVSNHTIQFTITDPVDAGETITITFEAGFSIPEAMDYEDVDVEDDSSDITLAASPSGASWGIGLATTTRVITLTSGTSTMASGSVVLFEIGTNATQGSSGEEQITNPATTSSYTITIGGTFDGTGEARVAIIGDVYVTASVGSSLTCSISGVSNSTAIKNTNTTITSTTTTIPFATLTAGAAKVAAQIISVSTNATAGFTVTLEQNQYLTSAGGANINCFDDGVCATTTGSYAAFSAPAGTLGSADTYGHFAFTSEDTSLGTNCGASDFGTKTEDKWGGLLGTTTDEVMCHDGPADGSTEHQGQTQVGFQIEISSLQESGDYSSYLTYICTPTY